MKKQQDDPFSVKVDAINNIIYYDLLRRPLRIGAVRSLGPQSTASLWTRRRLDIHAKRPSSSLCKRQRVNATGTEEISLSLESRFMPFPRSFF